MVNTDFLSNPTSRRKLLTALSGVLILAGLAVGRLAGMTALREGLLIAAALVAGSDIAGRAMASLRNRHASIELLVTIAAGGALVIGETWEAAAVTFLFLFGAYLEARTLNRTRQALQSLLDLAPDTALVQREGRLVDILAGEVQVGETVWVKPGTKIAVDGEVIEGRSAVNESAITGEPIPEEKGPGSDVFAGTVNGGGLLQVRTVGVGASTTLARIIRRVEEAQDEQAPTQRFIERFARWYTPAIITLSAAAYLLTRDLDLALTLLVIGCPGALVISTPVSVVAGIGRAAQRGILIKGGEYLENSGKISALAFDKTGTLTQGRPQVTDILPIGGPGALGESWPAIESGLNRNRSAEIWASQPELAGARGTLAAISPPAILAGSQASPAFISSTRWTPAQLEILGWAAAAETGSEHPLAAAILAAAQESEMSPPSDGQLSAADFQNYVGLGVRTIYAGRSVVVGSAALLSELGISIASEDVQRLEALKAAGKTAVFTAVDGTAVGILGISDPLRSDAAALIAGLRRAGLKRVVMLTGDDEITARAIAAEAGIAEVHAGLLPEAKLDWIRRLQADGQVVAMVGDGINDAPALAAADIGIALGATGSGLAIETADIALMTDDLRKIPEAIRISRATLRNIHQNVLIALVTVAVLLLGVLFGRVHMSGGMFVHEASVLIVILNAMRLLRM